MNTLMDINILRTAVTLASFVLFVAVVAHAWSRRRQGAHLDAAQLPFDDEEGARA